MRNKSSERPLLATAALASALLLPACPGSRAPSRTYSTSFPAAESPVSEGGKWIGGRAAGLDWADVRTVAGLAFGTESGAIRYDDSTALLAGPWGPEQTAQATVHSVRQNDAFYEEVELRLRSSLSAHRATGYEVNFRCSKTARAYTQIVRWNGPLGSFTILREAHGPRFGVAEGDRVKAVMAGDVISAFINGERVLQATDRAYAGGSPGIGFYLEGAASGVNRDFGFTTFTATAR